MESPRARTTLPRSFDLIGWWILLLTTNSGYGIGEPGKYCTEETPLRPLTLYIVSNDRFYATGFRPRHALDMGIRELIKGYTILRNTKYSNV